MSTTERAGAEFDTYAAEYDESLAAGLGLTGEGKDYYARRRIAWLRAQAERAGVGRIDRVLDFGCGDGDAAPLLTELLGARDVVGVDVSPAMLARARQRNPGARFEPIDALPSLGAFDVAYCNGVFHHIPVVERRAAAAAVRASLRPGGMFGLWENNPWNPGTRIVMKRVSFDRDAITLTPPETRRLLRGAGFTVLRTDHLFIFPRLLAPLRAIEPWVSRLPLGGQYEVLGRRDA